MIFSKDGARGSAEAALAVVAVGWTADTAALGLGERGRRDERPRVRARRRAPAHLGAPRLRGRRRHRAPDAGAPGPAGRIRRRDQRGPRTRDGDRERGVADRQLHRSRVRQVGRDRGAGAPNGRRRGRDGALRRHDAPDHRRAPAGLLQAHRRPRRPERSSGATSSATARSTSCRRPPSSSPPRCAWTTWPAFRFRSRPTRAFSAERRWPLPASSGVTSAAVATPSCCESRQQALLPGRGLRDSAAVCPRPARAGRGARRGAPRAPAPLPPAFGRRPRPAFDGARCRARRGALRALPLALAPRRVHGHAATLPESRRKSLAGWRGNSAARSTALRPHRPRAC